jgi:steroid 5-alpha reductase family enzyme
MLALLLACVMAGVFLGLHFKVLALLALSVLGAGVFIVAAWSADQNFADTVVNLIFGVISLHAGYMLGLTAREPYALLVRLNSNQSEHI